MTYAPSWCGSALLLPMPQTWILKGRRAEDEMYRSMWEHAMDEMIARVIIRNKVSGLTYVASVSPYVPPTAATSPTLSLACCLPSTVLQCVILKSTQSEWDDQRRSACFVLKTLVLGVRSSAIQGVNVRALV